jgi:hypothetical protein
MSLKRFLVACAAALAASMSASYAGPCSHEVDRILAEIDAKLEAKAAAGPSARESTAATMHRQPTPGSIAAAETRVVTEGGDGVSGYGAGTRSLPRRRPKRLRAGSGRRALGPLFRPGMSLPKSQATG